MPYRIFIQSHAICISSLSLSHLQFSTCYLLFAFWIFLIIYLFNWRVQIFIRELGYNRNINLCDIQYLFPALFNLPPLATLSKINTVKLVSSFLHRIHPSLLISLFTWSFQQLVWESYQKLSHPNPTNWTTNLTHYQPNTTHWIANLTHWTANLTLYHAILTTWIINQTECHSNTKHWIRNTMLLFSITKLYSHITTLFWHNQTLF